MFSALYFEESIKNHPRAIKLKERFSKIPHIACRNYAEIFNLKKQNFRSQKDKPALILAKKNNQLLLPIPQNYGIGHPHNYYFSHMLNCIFDCKYCYLQGQYRSAHYVVFVNFEDFAEEIQTFSAAHSKEEVCFFSGYECDSLALEPITRFVESFLPLFKTLSNAYLEIRTKSTYIQPLLTQPPLENAIISFSLNPQLVIQDIEKKTPSLDARLQAILQLQQNGWNIGLRFDPVVLVKNFKATYSSFFEKVAKFIIPEKLHSITLGSVRFPQHVFKNIDSLYKLDPFFAPIVNFNTQANMASYPQSIEKQMLDFCHKLIHKHLPEKEVLLCQ